MSKKFICLGFVAASVVLIPNLAYGQTAIIQQGSTTVNAEGRNNLAVGSVNQYAEQNRYGSPVNGGQLVIQQGQVNSEARGFNNTSVGAVEQNIIQNQYNPYGGSQDFFNQQNSLQQGYSNQRAIGEHNSSGGYLGQFGVQNQIGH